MDKRRDGSGRRAVGRGEPGGIWVAVLWGRVIVGLALAATGGVAFGHAWTNEDMPMWWVGGISLCVGVLLVLSGAYAKSRPPRHPPVEIIVPPKSVSAAEPLVPLLGAILVFKFRYITQKQLSQALAEQVHSEPHRRLGEILVLKGALTAAQLEEALALQQSVVPDNEPV